MTQYIEENLRTPVRGRYDVIVAGGGPAGIGAAVAAARRGCKTLLIEGYGFLGGMWTAGLVTPLFDAKNKGGIIEELTERLRSRGAWGGWNGICFDFEQIKLILDEMTVQSGAELLLHCHISSAIVEDGCVRGVIVENKSGRQAYTAGVVIDCTGDGDVAARAGAAFSMGRDSDGLTQPMTTMFRIGNIDFMQKTCDDLYRLIMDAVRSRGLDYDPGYTRPYVLMTPGKRSAVVMLTHVRGLCGLDVRDLTAAELEGRRQAEAAYAVFRDCIPEFKGVTLEQLAPRIGIRETRRIRGVYTLTLDDLTSGRRFDDGIAVGSFGVDIHRPDGDGQDVYKVKPYHIPYRCLVPDRLEGLLTAGRCISGTYEAHASYRVTGNCMAMGQGAGTAAALALAGGVPLRNIDPAALTAALRANGVVL